MSLPEPERSFFENRTGADLRSVRMHTAGPAAELAESLGAHAFSYGEHVAFAPGAFRPGTAPGRRLIAHELAHVLQQRPDGGAAPGGPPLRRAPRGLYFDLAGNCWVSGMSSVAIGRLVHRMVQDRMIDAYSGVMFAEVGIPGGGRGVAGTAPGRADLFFTEPIGIVPAVPGQAARPAPAGSSPPIFPQFALVGSIKPATMLVSGTERAAHDDLASYVDAHDAWLTISSGMPQHVTRRMWLPVPPAMTFPGIPFIVGYPPQALHTITLGDGMYWYWCRPLIEVLVPALWWLEQRMRDFLEQLWRRLRELGARLPAYARYALVAIMHTLISIAEAVTRWWEWKWYVLGALLLIALIILVVIFWKVIVAAVAAAGVAVATALARLFPVATAAALLFIMLRPGAAQAAPTPASGGSTAGGDAGGGARGGGLDAGVAGGGQGTGAAPTPAGAPGGGPTAAAQGAPDRPNHACAQRGRRGEQRSATRSRRSAAIARADRGRPRRGPDCAGRFRLRLCVGHPKRFGRRPSANGGRVARAGRFRPGGRTLRRPRSLVLGESPRSFLIDGPPQRRAIVVRVRRGHPRGEDFVTLPPGESTGTGLELTHYHVLDAPGAYAIKALYTNVHRGPGPDPA